MEAEINNKARTGWTVDRWRIVGELGIPSQFRDGPYCAVDYRVQVLVAREVPGEL